MGLKDVLISIGGDASHYEKSMNSIQMYTKKTTQLVSKYWMAAAAGATGLAYYIQKSLDAADAIGKTASKIGVTTDELQEYRYAAKLAGVEQSQLDMGLQRFSRRIAEVAAGTGELKAVVEQYGVKVRDSNGQMRSNSAIMADFANIIQNAESEQERLRIAFKLFDSEGAALVNMLKNGGSEMDAVRKKAHDLGMVISADLIANAEDANDQLATLSTILKTQFTAAAVSLAPVISEITQDMVDWVAANSDLLTQEIPAKIGSITEALKELKGPLAFAAEHWEILGGAYAGGKAYGPVGAVIGAGAGGWYEVWKEFITEYDRRAEAIRKKNLGGAYVRQKIEFPEDYSQTTTPAAATVTTGRPEISAEAEFDQEAVNKIIEDQLASEREAFDEVLAAENEFLQNYISQYQAAKDEQKALEEDLNERIMQLTLDEQDYKIWALNKEVAAMRETAAEEQELLAQIESYYDASMARISETTERTFNQEVASAVQGWASDFSSTLADLVVDGEANFADLAKSFEKMLAQMVIQKQLIEPMLNDWSGEGSGGGSGSTWWGSLKGIFGGAASAKGNVFAGPGIEAYENRIVGRPTLFPFARGVGLMGEAGYEGILPLTRTRSGDLGVKTEGGGGITEIKVMVQGNTVYDKRTMMALVSKVSAAVAEKVAPGAVVRDYRRDGITRSGLRG